MTDLVLSICYWTDNAEDEYMTAENSIDHPMAMEAITKAAKMRATIGHRLTNIEFYRTKGEHID